MNGEATARPATVLALQALIAFALLYVGAMLLGSFALAQGWIDETVPRSRREGLVAVYASCCLAVIVFAVLVRPPVPWRPAAAGRVLALYLPLAVVWLLFVIGYLRLMHRLGVTVPPQDFLYYWVDADAARPGCWLMVGTIVLLGPLAEEIVFRGYLQGALGATFGAPLALVASAAMFGWIHGWSYALPIGLLGLLFGWLRLRHRSLLAPVTAHAVHNGATVLLTCTVPGFLDWLYPR
jgi:membrane protease YdiL (CAAX protease family)